MRCGGRDNIIEKERKREKDRKRYSDKEIVSYLVAFLQLIVPVGVWEVNVTSRILHHLLNIVASLPDDMGVFRVRHVHL